MSSSPKYLLSVRLMTYNHAAFIIEAMESIDAQETNFDFEVVVGDDFSTDDNLKCIQSFTSKNPRAHWKILKREKGDKYSEAREKNGRVQNFYDILTHCNGKYIALLDGDDYWTDTKKLQIQVDFLEANSRPVGVFHNSTVVDENSVVTWPRYFEGEDGTYYNQFDSISKLRSGYSTGSLVYRQSAMKEQLEEFLKIGTDFILEVLLTNRGELYFMDKNMSAYRFHEGGIWQGSTEEKNNLETVNRYLFLYKNQPYRKKYNSFLWNYIMDLYAVMLKRATNNEFRQKINNDIYSFLDFTEFRTYRYLWNRFAKSIHYRIKILKKKL